MYLEKWDESRLDELVDLWNKELGEKFPMRKELFRQNSFQDPNISYSASSIAVDSKGNIIGFLSAKHWQDKSSPVQLDRETGWIQAILVASSYRNRGIGSQMLQKAEEKLQEKGIKRLFFGRDPWHYFPGIPADYSETERWACSKGYTFLGEDIDLKGDFNKEEPILLPSADGTTVEILQEEEQDELLAFLQRCFPGRWKYEAEQYFKKGGSGREYVVLKKKGHIIGFCRINDPDSPFIAQNVYWAPLFEKSMGGIGPLGIDSEERKKGYGRLIVEAGEAVLRQRGMEHIVIDWTGLSSFYEKLGYTPWKTYRKYEKILN